jgi:hypothetical protein
MIEISYLFARWRTAEEDVRVVMGAIVNTAISPCGHCEKNRYEELARLQRESSKELRRYLAAVEARAHLNLPLQRAVDSSS